MINIVYREVSSSSIYYRYYIVCGSSETCMNINIYKALKRQQSQKRDCIVLRKEEAIGEGNVEIYIKGKRKQSQV